MQHENHEPRNETTPDHRTHAAMADYAIHDLLEDVLCAMTKAVRTIKEGRQMADEGVTVETVAHENGLRTVRERVRR